MHKLDSQIFNKMKLLNIGLELSKLEMNYSVFICTKL